MPGRGWSSPVVAGGRVWLTTSVKEKGASLRALAFDVATGREAVNVEVFRLRSADLTNPKNSHASPTPIVDGDRVYVHFGAEGTAALTTSGEIVWKARFPYESQHGNGGSPVLYGDLLIFSCDGSDDAFVVALDKRTGKVRWKTSRRQPWDQAYSTPLVIRVGERDQLVSVGAYRAAAYDPRTGKEIWRVSYADGFSNVPRPVFGHGLVYIATGFQQPSLLAVRPDGTRRRHQDARRLDAEARRAADAVAAARRRRALHRQRRRHRVSASTPKTGTTHWLQRLGRRVLRVAGVRRRADLLSERGRHVNGDRAGKRVQAAGVERARRRDPRVDGGVGAVDLHPHRHAPVSPGAARAYVGHGVSRASLATSSKLSRSGRSQRRQGRGRRP